MKKRAYRSTLALAFVFAAVIAVPSGPSVAGGQWVHVRAVDGRGKQETVRINIPISLVEQVLPAIETKELKQGRIRLGEKDIDGVDLHAIWNAVRAAEDAEFVTVESADETVRVSKSGEYLLVRATGSAGKPESVDVRLPLDVVDALLSAPPGELNLQAAIKALKSRGDGELVSIDGHDGTVRIWIDRKSGSK